jgi:hypothetical protein
VTIVIKHLPVAHSIEVPHLQEDRVHTAEQNHYLHSTLTYLDWKPPAILPRLHWMGDHLALIDIATLSDIKSSSKKLHFYGESRRNASTHLAKL